MAGENVARLLGLAREFAGGARPKKMAIATIESELSVLAHERADAIKARETITERRSSAVMSGADFEEIRRIEDDAARLELILERLDLMEPVFLQRLHDAQTAARRAAWKRCAEGLHVAANEYLHAAKTAERAGRNFLGLLADAKAQFAQVCVISPAPVLAGGALVIDRALLENWHYDLEKFFASVPDIEISERPEVSNSQGVTMDFRGQGTDAVIFSSGPPVAPEVRNRPQTNPQQVTQAAAPTPPQIEYRHDIEIQPGEDGLASIHFYRRYQPDGGEEIIQPGLHRVTPGVALAAMRAGVADLVGPVTDEEAAA